MKKTITGIVALCVLLIAFTAPGIAAESKPVAAKPAVTKPAAAKPAAKPAAKTAAKPVAKKGAPSEEDLLKMLDSFAASCGASMNATILPCLTKKEVKKEGDKFIARYIAVDMASMTTSVQKSESSKKIPYIGYMRYQEVEYVCQGSTKDEAMSGPFQEVNRKGFTELVKYMNGKWTY